MDEKLGKTFRSAELYKFENPCQFILFLPAKAPSNHPHRSGFSLELIGEDWGVPVAQSTSRLDKAKAAVDYSQL